MKPGKGGYGEYEYLRGTTIRRGAAETSPQKVCIGKGGITTCHYPMDSDEAFKKRLKRYEAQRGAEAAAMEAASASPPAEAVPA